MIEHPDSEDVLEKLTNYYSNILQFLENGEMNSEKQDNYSLPKEEVPVIKKKKPIRRTMKQKAFEFLKVLN